MKTGIIGGGIIGLCTAYYLNKAGHEVVILEQGDLTDGCSFGNAGMIVPSHFIPLAAPGMIAKGIRWMFNSTSPFYVKPRLRGDLLSWGYHFYRSATRENVDRAIPALKELSLLSKSLYQQLSRELPFDFGYSERGLLMLYKTLAMEHEESETARIANSIGIEAHLLNPSEVQKLEPDVKVDVKGGIYFPGDAHLIPQQLVRQLIPLLKGRGVTIHTGAEVTSVVVEKNTVKALRTSQGDFEFDEVIVAAGSWSGSVGAMVGLNLPMQAGKGYSFTLPEQLRNVRVPSIFLEARVAVTPMGSSLRFGGTMEITGIDHGVSMNRVKGIVDAIPGYYPEMKVAMPAPEQIWHGLRPCSPDGLPYIGRLKKLSNVTIATGHSMMGLSLAPATGKIVSEIIGHEKESMPLGAFDPERFD